MAIKGIWQGYPLDADGNIIPGAEITIRDLNDNIVTLWEDEDGSVTKSNPFQADANGYAFAYANTGYYNIEAGAGTANTELQNVYIQAQNDDPIRIANGTSSTKVVYSGLSLSNDLTQSDIASGAVGQSELKTTTGEVSSSSASSTIATIPGGLWMLGFQDRATTESGETAGIFLGWASFGGGTESGGSWGATTDARNDPYTSYVTFSPTTDTIFFRSRYVQSSPPYNHGDGDIEGYVYAQLDSQGYVRSLYVCEDPPWYGNTNNQPVAQWRDKKTGKEYQRTRKLKCCKRDVDEGRISFEEFMERAGEVEDVVEEITPEVKLLGMDEIPKPFNEKEEHIIALVDPMDPLTGKLLRMMQAGEAVHDLFRDDYLRVDNEPCKRCGPPGVVIHKAKWKTT